MNSKCATCQKMMYRTDPCKGVGIEQCGRTDGGSKKLAASVAASTPSPVAPDSTLGDADLHPEGIARKPRGPYRSSQKGAASKSTNPEAKASKGKAEPRRAKVAQPDGDASRLSAGRTAQAEVSSPEVSPPDLGATLADQAITQAKRRGRPISPNPKSKRAEYQRNLMRDRRLKAEKEGKS